MLSDKDYEKYLNQIERVETGMWEMYQDLSMKVEDRELKNIFNSLAQSESRHESIVKKITDFFRSSFLGKNGHFTLKI